VIALYAVIAWHCMHIFYFFFNHSVEKVCTLHTFMQIDRFLKQELEEQEEISTKQEIIVKEDNEEVISISNLAGMPDISGFSYPSLQTRRAKIVVSYVVQLCLNMSAIAIKYGELHQCVTFC
jgi:hypothetical protein